MIHTPSPNMSSEATVRAHDVLRRSNNLKPERLDIKLPHISDWMPPNSLPTPPTSSEMDQKRHSFSLSDRDDDHDYSHDHLVIPSYGPIEQSTPLFGPISNSTYRTSSEPPKLPSPMPRDMISAKTWDSIVADFEQAIVQHSDTFRARHPTFHGPSIDDYRSVAAFTEQVHRRAPQELSQHSSPPSRPRDLSQDMSQNGRGGRTLAPRPLFPESPTSQHSPLPGRSTKRSQRVATEPSPFKRTRVSSTVSVEDEHGIDPPKKRRSTAGSSRRRSSGGNISPKEAKHNRNRSTKEKKSTDYRDYPADIAPAFETMVNPMEAAGQCPEHSVANPRNLQQDPLKDELHESERIISQKLNIDCAYFLCVKRQIFQRYLEHLKTKSFNWNKTAAQQCSNVDVGKTSQIFMFFQRVGWFNEELYTDKV